MIDIQSQHDERHIPIQKVGVKGVRYPITLRDKTEAVQHTTAVANLYADLPHHFKGTHMSRFIEVFEAHRSDLSMPNFLKMLSRIREELDAETAYADLDFPYFIRKLRLQLRGEGLARWAFICGGSEGARPDGLPLFKGDLRAWRPQPAWHRQPPDSPGTVFLDRGHGRDG
jgi:GTP cyclohydrolase FolE2